MALYEIPVLKTSSGKLTKQQFDDRLANIDAIIAKIETAMLATGSDPSIVEYELDTGQTEMRVKLTTTKELVDTLKTLDILRGRLVSQNQPRVVRLVPITSFRNNGF